MHARRVKGKHTTQAAPPLSTDSMTDSRTVRDFTQHIRSPVPHTTYVVCEGVVYTSHTETRTGVQFSTYGNEYGAPFYIFSVHGRRGNTSQKHSMHIGGVRTGSRTLLTPWTT